MEILPLETLKCPICLSLLNNPYILPCKCRSVACFECLKVCFNMDILDSGDEVQFLKKCLCNNELIVVNNITREYSIKRLLANIIINCKFSPNGCKFFISKDMNDSTLKNHEEICNYEASPIDRELKKVKKERRNIFKKSTKLFLKKKKLEKKNSDILEENKLLKNLLVHYFK